MPCIMPIHDSWREKNDNVPHLRMSAFPLMADRRLMGDAHQVGVAMKNRGPKYEKTRRMPGSGECSQVWWAKRGYGGRSRVMVGVAKF